MPGKTYPATNRLQAPSPEAQTASTVADLRSRARQQPHLATEINGMVDAVESSRRTGTAALAKHYDETCVAGDLEGASDGAGHHEAATRADRRPQARDPPAHLCQPGSSGSGGEYDAEASVAAHHPLVGSSCLFERVRFDQRLDGLQHAEPHGVL